MAQAPPTAGTQPLSPAAQEFHPLGSSPLPLRWRKRAQPPGIDVLGAEVTESSSEGESLPGYVQLQLQPAVTPAGLAIHGPSCGGTSSGGPPQLSTVASFYIGESMTSRTSTQMASSEPTPRLPALPEVRDGQVSIGLEVPEVSMIPSGGAATEGPLTPPAATVARAGVGDQVSRVLAREEPMADQRAASGPPLLMNESQGMLDPQQQNAHRQQQQEFL